MKNKRKNYYMYDYKKDIDKYINSLRPYRAINKVHKTESPIRHGFIDVRVVENLGDAPVEGVKVTLYSKENNRNVALMDYVTDKNGKIELIKVPVAFDRDNPSMDSEYYYTSYDLRIEKEGYFSVRVLNIQVFPDTTVNFDINITEVPESASYPFEEEIIEIPNI